jgi:hypothetical protein
MDAFSATTRAWSARDSPLRIQTPLSPVVAVSRSSNQPTILKESKASQDQPNRMKMPGLQDGEQMSLRFLFGIFPTLS